MDHEQLFIDHRFDRHPSHEARLVAHYELERPGVFERYAALIVGGLVACLLAGCAVMAYSQPVPCDQQAARMQGTAAPLAVILGDTDANDAKANREMIEAALNTGTRIGTLPIGLVAVDRGVRLPSGSTLQGQGPKTIIRNVQTAAPFGDNCTLQIHPDYNPSGIGYADSFTRPARSSITFADAATASKYALGSWLFTFRWNGYSEPGGSKTWAHKVLAKSGNTITLNSEPQPGANAAAYTRAAVRVSGALEGRSQLKVGAGSLEGFAPGRLVYITAGPVVGNECTGEMRRLMAVSSDGLTLDRPLRSTYAYQQSLAVLLNPVENVTVRDLTVQPYDDTSPPCYFKFVHGLTLQRLTVEGDIQCGLSSGIGIYDCVVKYSVNFNGCRDALVASTKCRHVYLEEACSDCEFANVVVSGSDRGGIVAVSGSPSERITLRDCIIERSADMPIHLIGRECSIDNVVVRNSANPVGWVNVYLGGDGTRVNNFRSDLTTVFVRGRGLSIAHIPTPVFLGWDKPGDQPTGLVVGVPNIDVHFLTPATLALWAFAEVQ